MDKEKLLQRQKFFVNLRFGMFIHFNSATVQFATGDLSDWEYDYENAGAPRRFPFEPKDWNPTELDCAQWAKAAKSAGMQFSALTTKHHEGFDLWPSKFTEHCVKNATNKTDVVKEYLSAFRNESIYAGLYFSMLDLHHGIGRKSCSPQNKQLIKDQIGELLTNYGDIPFLIVDGWNADWGGPSYESLPFEEIDAYVKSLQPDCLLMNISCESNLNHTDIVFYENAAGQKADDTFNGPGAGCNILTKQWFWRAEDTAMELKAAQWVIDQLQFMNSHNISFILNGAPNQKGKLDDNIVRRFTEIGAIYHKPADLTELPANWNFR